MELKNRRVHFAGCTPNPDETWMKQIARNLTDCEDGFLNGTRYLLMDRDGKFCPAFRERIDIVGDHINQQIVTLGPSARRSDGRECRCHVAGDDSFDGGVEVLPRPNC
jgi:hypothetical protein